ncbi:MAG: excinuclease ABC subunit C, partial [Bacteroidetes bacterium]|nr:excinuclease ABC subunit C [Bacteroidota bacterium]
KGTFVNELENIKGIGKNTTDQLLQKFKSVNNIKKLTEEELSEAIGTAKAKIIIDYFDKKQEA